MKYFIKTGIGLFLLLTLGYSQPLSLNDAIELALKNNYGILIAKNNAEKSGNTRKMKAGYLLPQVVATGSGSKSEIDYPNGAPAAIPGASGMSSDEWVYSAGASLSWTLFDGFKMFYGYKLVEEKAQMQETASRNSIESAVVSTATAFYNLASARAIYRSTEDQLQLSNSVYEESLIRFEYGKITKRELLNQQVQLNTDSSSLLERETDLMKAEHNFNITLGRAPETPVDITIDSNLSTLDKDLSAWTTLVMKHNTGLSIAEINKNIAASQKGIAMASLWPVLTANSSWTYNWSDYEYSRSTIGFNLSLPLFTGFSRITSIQNAELDKKNAQLSYTETKDRLKAFILQQWKLFEASTRKYSFEKKAVELAEESLEISREHYRLGRISDLQLRQSQLALLAANIRLESALFQNKVISLQIKQLAGQLDFKL